MRVKFLNPHLSTTFSADVDPYTTGGRCIQELIDADFIEQAPVGRPYALQVTRTQRQILPAMTMQDAGVIDNDALAILQMEQGAVR